MDSAKAAALRIRDAYDFDAPPTLDDLVTVCDDLGVTVFPDWPLAGKVREVYAYGSIALQKGLNAAWRRWCLAHGLGHFALHPATNHLYLARGGNQRYLLDRQEAQAECFAGHLLIGPLDAPAVGVRDWLDLAAWADVPVTCARRWLDLTHRQVGPFVSLDRMDVDHEEATTPRPGLHRERIWSGLLAASFAGVSLFRFDLNGDGVVQIVRAAEHVTWLFG